MANDNTKIQTGGGVGFSGLLFITFLVLKLTGTITWSWWWVTAPLWAPGAILLGILLIVGIIAFFIHVINNFY